MKPNSHDLAGILYPQLQYVVPVFQRYYRWERPQWEKLWENLMELQTPGSKGQHFMGFLVFVPEAFQLGKIQTLHVIDGQQRLTTLSLLLIALRNAAEHSGRKDLAREITECYLIHPHKQGNERSRVFLKLRDRPEYQAVLVGEPAAKGRITSALSFFEHKLSELPEAAEEQGLAAFLCLVTRRLQFMCATLEADNPYNIYKSLNSTGVPLGPADLIRNFVFMNLPPEQHDEFDEQLWTPLENRFTRKNGILDGETLSAFLRDFLMRDGRYVEPTNTFQTFEDRYTAMGFSPRDLAAELNRFADYYMVIRGERVDRFEAVTSAISQLNALKSSTTYPLLLHLFDIRAQGMISNEQLADAIHLLAGFILRRFVCGAGSRGYGQLFVKAASLTRPSPVESLKNFLLSKDHPDDQRFKKAFVSFNLFESAYGRFILESLETARGHREPADLSVAQVEHIMPQTLSHPWRRDLGPEADRIFATWLHTPGNLALSAYNQELWNRTFAEKRIEYARSNIGMTRELARFERWSEAEIRGRGEVMAEMAAKIWVGPKEATVVIIGPPPEDQKLRVVVNWSVGSKSRPRSVICEPSSALTLATFLQEIYEVYGDHVFETFKQITVRGCPLVSPSPDLDFMNRRAGKRYGCQRIRGSDHFVFTTSSTPEKLGQVIECVRRLGMPETMVEAKLVDRLLENG